MESVILENSLLYKLHKTPRYYENYDINKKIGKLRYCLTKSLYGNTKRRYFDVLTTHTHLDPNECLQFLC